MLNKNSLIPLYIQLENILIELIKEEMRVGDIIPSENELAKKYSVSRMTAKKAIDNLTIKGLVERVKGKGTFVVEQDKKIELPLNKLRGFTQRVKEIGLIPKNIVPIFEKRRADKKIASILNIEEDTEVWYMERVRKIGEIPAVFEQSYIAVDLLPNLSREELLKSKFEYVKKQGLKIDNSERNISAEIPDDYVASFLQLKRNEPILLAECMTYLKDGRVLEYSKIFYNQKKYRFKLYAN